jgi:hypothetical protein
MEKNILFLSIFLASPIFISAGHCQAVHQEIDAGDYQEQLSLHATIQKYFVSTIPGIIIGATTGMFCAFLDHIVHPLWPFFWIGSYYHRTHLTNSLCEDYTQHHVPHDRILLECCALISTWLTHYKVYESLNGNPPF